MKLGKMAVAVVSYYVDVTGNAWSKFYDDLDEAMSKDLSEQTGDLWLIHSLTNVMLDNGLQLNELKVNKDVVKAAFDNEGRKLAGEFFTPIVWAEELHKYMDKYIPNWRDTYNVWENSCYSMDTEVLTKRGWKFYDELKDNDEIYTLNPVTFNGEWSGFHNRFKKPFAGKMVGIRGAGVDLLVTPDHKLYCGVGYSVKSRKYKSICASELFSDYAGAYVTDSTVLYSMINGASISPAGVESDIKTKSLAVLMGCFYRTGRVTDTQVVFVDDSDSDIRIESHLRKVGVSYIRNGNNICVEDGKFMSFILDNCVSLDGKKAVNINKIAVDCILYVLSGVFGNSFIVHNNKECFAKSSYRVWLPLDEKILMEGLILLGTQVGYGVELDTGSQYSLTFSSNTNVVIKKDMIYEVDYSDNVWDLTTSNDSHIFLVRRNGKPIFSKNCGSGNLIRTAKINPEHLFASSLQADDINLINSTPELKGCTAFQLDFLSDYDITFSNFISPFTDKLPEKLQDIINNDKPLIFLCNPPYKTGQANATAVGKYMNSGKLSLYNNTDFSKPSYDLFYQFCFQVMNLVAQHKLKNVYYCVFGPLTWFTGAGANILLKQFEHCFEFIDGMCISAQEFSDTSESILWGISATIWKSRGGYIDTPEEIGLKTFHKDILLDKKFLTPDGEVGCEGKVLYAPPREKLSEWVVPNDIPTLSLAEQEQINAPVLTSHLTFKGGSVFEKTAYKTGKILKNALGTLMVGNTLTRSADQSAILSCPTTIQYVSITKENFWRCIASYAFRRTIDAGWAIAKKEISAPDTTVEGYDLWLKNAIVPFLFEYKSMMSSMRGVVWDDQKDLPDDVKEVITIRNNFFFLTPEEVRANCTDPIILKDLEDNPQTEGQKFMLEVIKECEPYWSPEIKQLYDWCKTYTLATYDARKTVDYKGSLDAWDAGFQQLRAGLWNAEKLDGELTKLLVQARDYLRKDLNKFGFVSEVENEDL